MSQRRQSNGKSHGLDADVRARIQESHERAKFVLEASKMALDAQSHQLGKRGGPGRLDISNLFGHQSYTLPSAGSKEPVRKSLSPRPSFDPVHDDMQSTRKTIEPPDDHQRILTEQQTGRNGRNRYTLSTTEMANRSTVNGKDMSVADILAGSRSERVRRMSQGGAAPPPMTSKSKTRSQNAAVAMFEQDENNFIAEIPAGFQPRSPPTCQTPKDKKKRQPQQYQNTDSAKIPIQLDDFGGEGYLLKNEFSFNQMCNKVSNRTDSICNPLEMNSTMSGGSSFYTDDPQNQMMADAFHRLNNNNATSIMASYNSLSQNDDNTLTQDNCKLKGGANLDGAVCLDCSKKCQCEDAAAVAKVERCRSPKRDCDGQRKKLESLLKKQQQQREEPSCRIMEDQCKPGALKIECVIERPAADCDKPEVAADKKQNMDFCDQHLSYLDRVMKSLDLCKDSPKKKANNNLNNKKDDCAGGGGALKRERDNNNCRAEMEIVSARKAKSMLAVSECCTDSGINNSTSCCNNDDLSNNKAMSVCSQGAFSHQGGRDVGDLRRAQSQMSTLSDFNFVTGYLPLKSTHNEISWPSVKLRKSVNKSFQIKNTSTKRLIIRVILDGPGFNFENPEANAKGTMTLQPNEVRTLQLIFNPTVLGPAIGNLIFQPPIELCSAGGACATMSTINSPVTKRVIRLYGYGGHVAMSFERLQQGPVGSKFLPLGNLCNLNKVFEETFIVRNKGNLTGFAAVMLENKTVGKSMFDHAIKICPDKVLIPANSAVKVKVSFGPTGSDMREMMKIHRDAEVIAIGNILVVTGDEPTRCRMKRLITASNELADKYSSAQLQNIWADYGTHDCDYDLSELRETGLAVADLMSSFQSKEVALTVNNSTTDMSLIDASGWISEVEDSDALFHTICQPGETSECCVSPPNNDAHMLPLEAMHKCEVQSEEDPCHPDQWYVTPNSLSFNTNAALPQVLTIHSRTSKNRMFEVDSNVANYFCVSPQEGVITPACDTTNISVRMMNYNVPDCQLFIYIYIENDRICVPVTVERGPPEGKATCAKISCEKVANLA